MALPKVSPEPERRPALSNPLFKVGEMTLFRMETAAASVIKEPIKITVEPT